LLVDDDDNNPDVRGTYVFVLDALGVGYDVWDTENSDNEPTAADLAAYETVIWFTGDSSQADRTGPGPEGEAALSDFLAADKCLLMSSQSYYNERGLTPFMATELGVSSVTNDTGQTSVTGTGGVFGGLGPYGLNYFFTNQSDTLTPDGTAAVGFDGNMGNAALTKEDGYRTTFFGFPYVTIPNTTARSNTMTYFLDWCGELHVPAVGADQEGSGPAGETVDYTFTVTNTGTVADTYLFSLESDWAVTQSLYESELLPGETVEVTIAVEIPAGATVGETDSATLTVRSLSTSSIAVAAEAVTTVVGDEVEFLMFLPVLYDQP